MATHSSIQSPGAQDLATKPPPDESLMFFLMLTLLFPHHSTLCSHVRFNLCSLYDNCFSTGLIV